jgi:hypothetical protein
VLNSLLVPQPLRLQIKSQDTGLESPPDSPTPIAEDSQPKRRRVRFEDEEIARVIKEPLIQQIQQKLARNLGIPNLSNEDMCSFLQQTCAGHTLKQCVGYLDSYTEKFRHSIYPHLPGTYSLQKAVSIDKVLVVPAEKSVSVADQLNLARSLVAAVLKFHSTPWLAQYLTLQDVLLFPNSQDFAQCLATLHVDTSFEDVRLGMGQSGEATPDASLAGTPIQEKAMSTMATAIEDARLDHGIRNMTVSQE